MAMKNELSRALNTRLLPTVSSFNGRIVPDFTADSLLYAERGVHVICNGRYMHLLLNLDYFGKIFNVSFKSLKFFLNTLTILTFSIS